jgi:hypothetical protein
MLRLSGRTNRSSPPPPRSGEGRGAPGRTRLMTCRRSQRPVCRHEEAVKARGSDATFSRALGRGDRWAWTAGQSAEPDNGKPPRAPSGGHLPSLSSPGQVRKTTPRRVPSRLPLCETDAARWVAIPARDHGIVPSPATQIASPFRPFISAPSPRGLPANTGGLVTVVVGSPPRRCQRAIAAYRSRITPTSAA